MRLSITRVILCALMLSHLAHAESKPDDNAVLQYWRAFAMMPTLDDYSRPRIDIGPGRSPASDNEIVNSHRAARLRRMPVRLGPSAWQARPLL